MKNGKYRNTKSNKNTHVSAISAPSAIDLQSHKANASLNQSAKAVRLIKEAYEAKRSAIIKLKFTKWSKSSDFPKFQKSRFSHL